MGITRGWIRAAWAGGARVERSSDALNVAKWSRSHVAGVGKTLERRLRLAAG